MIADGYHGHVMSGTSLALKTLLFMILPTALTNCFYKTLINDWSTQVPKDYKLWIPLLDKKNCTSIEKALLNISCLNRNCINNISCNKTHDKTKELYICLKKEDIDCDQNTSPPDFFENLLMNLSEFKEVFDGCLKKKELNLPTTFTCSQVISGTAASSTSTTTIPTTNSTTTTPTTTSTTTTPTTSSTITSTTDTSTISTPSLSTVKTNNETASSDFFHASQSFKGSVLALLMLSVTLNIIFLGLLLRPRQKPTNTCEHCGLSDGQRLMQLSSDVDPVT